MAYPKAPSIVIPYIMGPYNGLELRFALRSIQKYFSTQFGGPHNINIFILGEKPNWLQNVVHVNTQKTEVTPFMRFLDTTRKLNIAAHMNEISNDFIYMYDDTIFLNIVSVNDIAKLRATQDMRYVDFNNIKYEINKWHHLIKKCNSELVLAKKSQYNYETHLPRMYSREKIAALIQKYRMDENPYNFATMYFNSYFSDLKPEIIGERNQYKLGLYKKRSIQTIRRMTQNQKILNFSPEAFNRDLIEYLHKKLFEKSIYEADTYN